MITIALTILAVLALIGALVVAFVLGRRRGRHLGLVDATLRLLGSGDVGCQEAARYLHLDRVEETKRQAERAKQLAEAQRQNALQAKVIEIAVQRLGTRATPKPDRPEHSVDELAKAETHRFVRPKR